MSVSFLASWNISMARYLSLLSIVWSYQGFANTRFSRRTAGWHRRG